MRRRSTVAFAFCLLAILGVAVPAVAGGAPVDPSAVPGFEAAVSANAGTHGNHVSIDPQVTSGGTVVVETVSMQAPGFVVLKTDDDGQPGDPVGHTSIEDASFQTSVPVNVSADAWADWTGNETLWAVLHADDGDGAFDPETDPSLESRSPTARTSFKLGRTDAGSGRVLARSFEPQKLENGSLTVRQVDLASDGYVVAKPRDGDGVVGSTWLDAGSHANVSLSLNESFLATQRDQFRLRLVAYRDDGDGRFGDGDRPVRVGADPVATDIIVTITSESGSNETATTDEPLVVTPSPTPTNTAASTGMSTQETTIGPADGTSPDEDSITATVSTTDSTASGDSSAAGPGFGALAVIGAFAVIGALALFSGVSLLVGVRRRRG